MNFQGHMMTVKCLYWSLNDEVLFSAGMDGNVYGWQMYSQERMDVVTANSRSSAILTVHALTLSPPLFCKADDDEEEAVAHGNNALEEDFADTLARSFDRVILTCMDGSIRCPVYCPSHHPNVKIAEDVAPYLTPPYQSHQLTEAQIASGMEALVINITCVALSVDKRFLFAGTNVGSLRVYTWPLPSPPSTEHSFIELFTQSQAIVAVVESPSGRSVSTVSEDGSIFVFRIERAREIDDFDTGLDLAGLVSDGGEDMFDKTDGYNFEFLQVSASLFNISPLISLSLLSLSFSLSLILLFKSSSPSYSPPPHPPPSSQVSLEDFDYQLNQISDLQKKLSESQV